jgi:hypothetical protein
LTEYGWKRYSKFRPRSPALVITGTMFLGSW